MKPVWSSGKCTRVEIGSSSSTLEVGAGRSIRYVHCPELFIKIINEGNNKQINFCSKRVVVVDRFFSLTVN